MMGRLPATVRNTTFRGYHFRRCRHFFIFKPPSLLIPRVVPTAANDLQGRRGFYIRAERASLPRHAPDTLAVQIQVVNGARTFTFQDSQPCRLLPFHLLQPPDISCASDIAPYASASTGSDSSDPRVWPVATRLCAQCTKILNLHVKSSSCWNCDSHLRMGSSIRRSFAVDKQSVKAGAVHCNTLPSHSSLDYRTINSHQHPFPQSAAQRLNDKLARVYQPRGADAAPSLSGRGVLKIQAV
jgi:hypothetical protein